MCACMCRYCKNNPDRKYSRCKVPQEMSDKEINEELGMEDDEGAVVAEEAPKVPLGLQSPLEPFPSHVAKTLDVTDDAVLSGWLTIPTAFSMSCCHPHLALDTFVLLLLRNVDTTMYHMSGEDRRLTLPSIGMGGGSGGRAREAVER